MGLMTTVEKAVVLWPVLVATARKRDVMSYADCTETIGGIAQGVGKVLGPIQRYCQAKKLPPLTAVVVRKGTLVQGEGFDGDDALASLQAVWDYRWDSIPGPSVDEMMEYW